MKNSKISLIEQLQTEILNVELAKRKSLDPSYSVRKFSAEAGVDSSTMSKYLKNTRKMSEYIFKNILHSLKVSQGTEDEYSKKVLQLDILEKQHSEIRANWYYYAILELTTLVDFQSDIKWMSNKLSLDFKTTHDAVELLKEVGALVIEDNKFKDNLGNVSFVEHVDMDIEEGRIHQTQLLQKSIYSVNNNDSSIKDHTSYSFALDSSLVPEVKQLIEEFTGQLANLIDEKSKENDSVYTVQVNLTSLTKPS
jgi:hypothetical protein